MGVPFDIPVGQVLVLLKAVLVLCLRVELVAHGLELVRSGKSCL
jgi:hypothetical protein